MSLSQKDILHNELLVWDGLPSVYIYILSRVTIKHFNEWVDEAVNLETKNIYTLPTLYLYT